MMLILVAAIVLAFVFIDVRQTGLSVEVKA
jgi:hypothetical protein